MPKVGIMTDVSSGVFENVVSPAKAERRFNKLVSNLLEVYYSNETVRSIVDGNAEVEHLEGVATLKEQLSQATNSLNTMGIYEESLQMSLDSAKEDFSSVTESEKVEFGEVRNKDFEDFKSEILESQRSFMEDMRSLLSEVLSSKSSDVVTPKGVEVVTSKEDLIKQEVKAPVTGEVQQYKSVVDDFDNELEGDEPLVFNIVEEPKPDTVSGDDILKNLLGSNNSISFGG